jgi:predicted esterase
MRPRRTFLKTVLAIQFVFVAFTCAGHPSIISNVAASEPNSEKRPLDATLPGKATEITRADLAAAYLRLERAFFARLPVGERLAEVNKSFDKATLAFFTGQNAEAIRAIDSLTRSLAADNDQTAASGLVSLKATVDPPVWNLDGLPDATCRVVSIYDWTASEARELTVELRLVDPADSIVFRQPLSIVVGANKQVDVSAKLDLRSKGLAAGQYRVELATGEGEVFNAGYLNVVEGAALDQQRAENEKELAPLAPSDSQMIQAVRSCQARNRLLNDKPSSVNSAQFLADLNRLASDVASEVKSLKSGQDPYQCWLGDHWRVLRVGSRDVPMRIYAPRSATKNDPLPLLVVLHGMGGDENMFQEAYGAGIIKRIADEREILIASPLTYAFNDAKSLEACIETMGYEYAVDKNRVYVLGHSLGANTTARLVQGRSDIVAGACCIAGGSFQVKGNTPPLLVVSPELDAVVPAKMLRASAAKAIQGGMPIEIREMPGYGHTLAVGAALPDAVDWLLKHGLGRD